jgi:hypothetical protein
VSRTCGHRAERRTQLLGRTPALTAMQVTGMHSCPGAPTSCASLAVILLTFLRNMVQGDGQDTGGRSNAFATASARYMILRRTAFV